MLTPTLFDITAITRLNPIGETFTPIIETDNKFIFELSSFKNHISDHHKKKIEEVSDQEHIAFLTLFLSYFFFCSNSLQIAKKYSPLGIQLHEGRRIFLSKLLLVTLYQSIGNTSYKLKHIPETNKKIPSFWSLLDFAVLVECHIRTKALDNHVEILDGRE